MIICPSCMAGSLSRTERCAECGADLASAPDRKGTQLVDMVIERKVRLTDFIGEGAMGWVYRGLHLSLDSSVAVKLMKPTGDVESSTINDERFAREARAASGLNNPHIISIMDFGRTPGGLLYIVSELLRGSTLSQLIQENGPLPLGRCLRIADQILVGLEDAHAASLIHRDLKPDNIMITPLRSGEDFVKILDFGIAKLGDRQTGARLTQQGQVIGTPTYMAPEQIRGKNVGPQSDLYSLSCIIFEMVAGRPPFDSEALMEVLGMHLSAKPPTLRSVVTAREIPDALEDAIARCLRKRPNERFEDAGALRRALASIAEELARQEAHCHTCGAGVADTARFCANCGASLVSVQGSHAPDVPAKAATNGATADTVFHPRTQGGQRRSHAPQVVSTGNPLPVLHANTLNRRLRVEQTFQLALSHRERETEASRTFLASKTGALEILGPVGSGRTRLIHEVAELAEGMGLLPILVGADPTMARRPWHPVRQAVSWVLGIGARPSHAEIDAAMRREGIAQENRLGLVELFELRDPEAYVEHAVRLRETRAAALHCLGLGLAAGRSRVVLVDDADDLDGASRALFVELGERADGKGLKVILVAEKPLLDAALSVPHITPQPLPREAISALLQTIDPQGGTTWTGRLHLIAERTGGNPLHVVQALRLLAEGGTEVDAPLGDIVITRVQRLPTEALRLLQTVSVIGRRASLEQVAALLGHEPLRFGSALQLLFRRDLLQEVSPGELEITHPRVAELVRESIPADRRRALHREVLEELSTAGESVVTLARHAAEARLGEEALDLLRAAGVQAELMLDDGGAALHYRRALEVARWELLLEEHHDTCLDLALRLGNSLRYSGDHLGAMMVLQEAVGDSEGKPAFQAKVLHSLSLAHLAQGQTALALERIQEAVSKAFFAGEPEFLSQIYIDMGRVLDVSGHKDRALQELAEGVLMVTGGDGPHAPGAPDSFWRLLAFLSDLQFRQDNLPAALEAAHAALEQATRHQSRIGTARCHFLLGRCHDRLGDPDRAEMHHGKALATFRQLGDRQSVAEVLLSNASVTPEKSELISVQANRLLRQVKRPTNTSNLPS